MSMNFNYYQQQARKTAIYPSEKGIEYCALKLCGESGEVAEKIGKVIRDNNSVYTEEKKQELAKEVGDVLWYCANLAHELGFSLDDVASMNLEKLMSRMNRGVLGGSGDNR